MQEFHHIATILAAIQLVFSIIIVLIFSILPLNSLFWFSQYEIDRKKLATYYFTACFHQLADNDRLISYGLWICVFVAKFTESYFFLTLSLRDPIRELSVIDLPHCIGDQLIGTFFCRQQARVVFCAMVITDLVLFFLDTYLWYIIFNTLFSVARSLYLGASIWTPWRDVYLQMPKRIHSKVLFSRQLSSGSDDVKDIIYHIWNAIIISMLRDHLLPVDQVEALLYHFETNDKGERSLSEQHSLLPGNTSHSEQVHLEHNLKQNVEYHSLLNLYQCQCQNLCQLRTCRHSLY